MWGCMRHWSLVSVLPAVDDRQLSSCVEKQFAAPAELQSILLLTDKMEDVFQSPKRTHTYKIIYICLSVRYILNLSGALHCHRTALFFWEYIPVMVQRIPTDKCSCACCAPHYAADQLCGLELWCVPLYSELGEKKTSNTERCHGTTIQVQVGNSSKIHVIRICWQLTSQAVWRRTLWTSVVFACAKGPKYSL